LLVLPNRHFYLNILVERLWSRTAHRLLPSKGKKYAERRVQQSAAIRGRFCVRSCGSFRYRMRETAQECGNAMGSVSARS